jgi:hypothetical protein
MFFATLLHILVVALFVLGCIFGLMAAIGSSGFCEHYRNKLALLSLFCFAMCGTVSRIVSHQTAL